MTNNTITLNGIEYRSGAIRWMEVVPGWGEFPVDDTLDAALDEIVRLRRMIEEDDDE